jgi:hypothetical protein
MGKIYNRFGVGDSVSMERVAYSLEQAFVSWVIDGEKIFTDRFKFGQAEAISFD